MTNALDRHTLPAVVRGAAWMVLAAFSYAGTGALVRHLADDFSVFEIAFFRCSIAVFMIAPLVLGAPAASFACRGCPMTSRERRGRRRRISNTRRNTSRPKNT